MTADGLRVEAEDLRIEVDDLTGPGVRAIIAEHLADMHATSPAESVHALDLSQLQNSSVTVWVISDGPVVLGCAALKELSATHGEIKSMRVSSAVRGRGVGTRLLRHVQSVATSRGYRRLSLETGTQDFFAPARRLYARHGFQPCAPFGDYTDDPNSAYFTLELAPYSSGRSTPS